MTRTLKLFAKNILFLIIISTANTSAHSSSSLGILKANELYSYCSSEQAVDHSFCEGYIIGVNDSMFSGHLSNVFQVCFPPGISIEQLRLVLIKYMETIPEKLHYIADGIVAEGLATVFQCQQN